MANHPPSTGRSPLLQPLPVHVYLAGSALAITLGVLEKRLFKVERPLALRLFDTIASRRQETPSQGQALKPRISSQVDWTTSFHAPDVDDVGNALTVTVAQVYQAPNNDASTTTFLPYLDTMRRSVEPGAPNSYLELPIIPAGPLEFSYTSSAFFDASDTPTPTSTQTEAHPSTDYIEDMWQAVFIVLALVALGILVLLVRSNVVRMSRSDVGVVVKQCVVFGKLVVCRFGRSILRVLLEWVSCAPKVARTNNCSSPPPVPKSPTCLSSPNNAPSPGRKARKALRPKPKLRTGLKVRKSIFEIDWDVAQLCVPGCQCGQGLDSCSSSDTDTGCTIT